MTNKTWLLTIVTLAALLCWGKAAYPSTSGHLLAGYVVGNVTGKLVEKVAPEDKWARFFIPVVLSGLAAWCVEWAQFQDNRGSSSDVAEDIGTTMLGGALGATIEIPF